MSPLASPLSGPLAATFLDLPAGSPGGSVELFLDLYTGDKPLIPARAFMLAPTGVRPRLPAGLELLSVTGKCLEGPAFGRYVAALRTSLTAVLDTAQISVVHLQHLAFGATPALMRGRPPPPPPPPRAPPPTPASPWSTAPTSCSPRPTTTSSRSCARPPGQPTPSSCPPAQWPTA
jgi:hypothetical protein